MTHSMEAARLPLVSVVVPCLDAAHWIGRCLESVRANDYPRDRCELIVVDNGSRDDTVAIARRYADQVQVLPGVTISALRNAGAATARGEVLAFLDADCLARRDWLRAGVAALAEARGLYGYAYDVPEPASRLERDWFAPRDPGRREASELGGGNLFLRKDDFAALGGFDETLVTGEDAEFSRRAKRRLPVVSDDRIRVVHLGNPKTLRAFFWREVWCGLGAFGSARIQRFDKPLAGTIAFLVLTVGQLAGLVSLALDRSASLFAGSTLLLGALLGATIWVRRRFLRSPLHALRLAGLYYVYFLARSVSFWFLATRRPFYHRSRTGRPAKPASERNLRGGILLVANYPSDVGYAWWLMENFWRVIAIAADRVDRRTVLAYPRITTLPESIRSAPLESVESLIGRRSPREVWNGLHLIRRYRIRSVYLTDWPALHWIYPLWRLAGVRRIVLHDHTPGDAPPARGATAAAKRLLHRLALFSADIYVGVSEPVVRRFTESAGVPPERCRLVRNGIVPFRCDTGDRARVRSALGIPQDAVLIVLVSRATRYKGIDFAIRCLAEIIRHLPSDVGVHAVHCGDGPDLERLRELTEELGVADRVRLLGHRTDVRAVLCAADIGFHTSSGEGMSLAVLEFLCAGLAVLTSDRPSVSVAIAPGITGLTYRHGEVSDAVRKLRELILEPDLRRRLGDAGSEAGRRDFDLAKTNQSFLENVVSEL